MDDHPKKQKIVEDSTTIYKEEILFNTDILSKVISCLPSIDLLNLALTCTRFGVSNTNDDSIIEKSVHIAIQEIATEEQLAALPNYNGDSTLADYHYLQLLKEPLTFDQLIGAVEYVNEDDKSFVRHSGQDYDWGTAISNNVMRAGKHYVSFTFDSNTRSSLIGVMRPGQANESASGAPIYLPFFRHFSRYIPVDREFCQHFSRYMGHGEHTNNIHCCMYGTANTECWTSGWGCSGVINHVWDGMESISFGEDELGMLFDLEERTLTVYKNGRKLGVMKRGLVGPYCWAVSMRGSSSVRIKRGTIPRG